MEIQHQTPKLIKILTKRRNNYECGYCGEQFEADKYEIKRSKYQSCGCIARKLSSMRRKTHGESRTRLYKTWSHMVSRITNPKDKSYRAYGGAGLGVDSIWEIDFTDFRDWAMSNGYTDDLTIDRIDNGVGYFPNNCRFVSRSVQSENRGMRSDSTNVYKGVMKTPVGKFVGRITINKKRINLGTFPTELEAALAYDKAVDDFNSEHSKNF